MNIIVRSSLFMVIFEHSYLMSVNPAAARARAQAAAAALKVANAISPHVARRAQAVARAAVIARIAQSNRVSAANRAAAAAAAAVVAATPAQVASAASAPPTQPVYNAKIDWRKAFQGRLRKPLRDMLVLVHKNSAAHHANPLSDCPFPELLQLIVDSPKIKHVFDEVQQSCTDLKIRCADNTTQNASTFLLWVMCRLTTDDCYKKVDHQLILKAIRALLEAGAKNDYRNEATKETPIKCCGKIDNRDLAGRVSYVLHHGTMPVEPEKRGRR